MLVGNFSSSKEGERPMTKEAGAINPDCNDVTAFYCGKCMVNLTLAKSRNCVRDFHTK